MGKIGLAFLFLAAGSAAQAAPRSLRCDFADGTSRLWDRESRQTFGTTTIVYDGIDPAQGRARLVGKGGTVDVSLIATPRRLSFVEVVPDGTMNITSVYETATDMKAVHSRHAGTPENPALSQTYGYCKPY